MRNTEAQVLADMLADLSAASEALQYTLEKCRGINLGSDLSRDDEDRFEALSSKFARLSDMLIKKAFRLIDRLDLEEPAETVRDALAKAEKKGLIQSERAFVRIRRLRNEIAHEYAMEDYRRIYEDVLEWSPLLMDAVNRVEKYAQRYST